MKTLHPVWPLGLTRAFKASINSWPLVWSPFQILYLSIRYWYCLSFWFNKPGFISVWLINEGIYTFIQQFTVWVSIDRYIPWRELEIFVVYKVVEKAEEDVWVRKIPKKENSQLLLVKTEWPPNDSTCATSSCCPHLRGSNGLLQHKCWNFEASLSLAQKPSSSTSGRQSQSHQSPPTRQSPWHCHCSCLPTSQKIAEQSCVWKVWRNFTFNLPWESIQQRCQQLSEWSWDNRRLSEFVKGWHKLIDPKALSRGTD